MDDGGDICPSLLFSLFCSAALVWVLRVACLHRQNDWFPHQRRREWSAFIRACVRGSIARYLRMNELRGVKRFAHLSSSISPVAVSILVFTIVQELIIVRLDQKEMSTRKYELVTTGLPGMSLYRLGWHTAPSFSYGCCFAVEIRDV